MRKEPRGFSVPGCGGLPSGLVKLLAGHWGGVRGARLLRLGFPQVVIAEVALEALELGIVMVGCGVVVWAAGLWQVVSAKIPICRKTDQSAQRAHEQPSGCLLRRQQRERTRVSKTAAQEQLDLGKAAEAASVPQNKPQALTCDGWPELVGSQWKPRQWPPPDRHRQGAG